MRKMRRPRLTDKQIAHMLGRYGPGRAPGRASLLSQVIAVSALKSGMSPLEFMLTTMRDETQPFEVRAEMAKAAAPYCHPKLSAISHTGEEGGPVQHQLIVRFGASSDETS